jgi:hypothetical protein
MDALTQHEREILRLWSVIRRLLQWKEFDMTDQEEAVFGTVYQLFKKTPSFMPANPTDGPGTIDALKLSLAETAAGCLRALYDLQAR